MRFVDDAGVGLVTATAAVASRDGRWPESAGRRGEGCLGTSRRAREFRAGRLAAARALGGLMGVDAVTRIHLVAGPTSQPSPAWWGDDGTLEPIDAAVSLSHTDGKALAAASADTPCLGVDLEGEGQVPRAWTSYFLTRSEQRLVGATDPTELWCLKEAAWKAFGVGPHVPFKRLELRFDGNGALCGVIVENVHRTARARLLRPWSGFVAAVVWGPRRVR